MVTRLYLLRHGATAANNETPYRLQGKRTDLLLDSVGRRQALCAAEALRHQPLVAVYSSPLSRSRETARLIADPHHLQPIVLAELMEGDVGRWEGLTWDQARAQDPEQYARFHAHPGSVPYPDGESFLEVGRRATAAIGKLARTHAGGQFVVVGHNILNRAYLAPLLGLTMDQARGVRQANGGISVIEYEEGGEVRLITLNSILHLDHLDTHGEAVVSEVSPQPRQRDSIGRETGPGPAQ